MGREADVRDGRTLLTQLDAEDVDVLAVDAQQLSHFIAEFVVFAFDDVLRAVFPDADKVLVGYSGHADGTGIDDGFVGDFADGDRHVGRHVVLRVLPVGYVESQVISTSKKILKLNKNNSASATGRN